MATQVASLYATIGAKTDEFEKGAAKVKGELNGGIFPALENAKKGVDGFMQQNAALMGVLGGVVAAGGAYVAFMQDAQKEAANAEQTQAKLEAVLKSTGGAAGLSAEQLNEMAVSMGNLNAIDDDVVKNGEAVLLTFTQVGKSVFPQATQAAIDMSAVFGGDLQGSIMQVGKAMNDFSGYTALKRAGVSFTEEQIAQIDNFKKTNDLVGYQNLVLAELQKEFGGAAAAMAQASLGTQQLNVAMGNFKETVGKAEWLQNFNYGVAYTLNTFDEWISKTEEQTNRQEELQRIFGMSSDEMKRAQAASSDFAGQVEATSAQLDRGAAMTDFYRNQLQNMTAATEDATAAQDTYKSSNEDVFSIMMDLQSQTDSYNADLAKLNDKMAALTAEQANYVAGSKKYNEVQGEIDDTKTAIDQLAKKQDEATKKMIFNMLQQRAAADGMSEAEFNALLAIGEGYGLIDQKSADSALAVADAMDKMTNAMNDPKNSAKDLLKYFQNIMAMDGQTVNLTVNTNYTQTGNTGGASGTTTNGGGTQGGANGQQAWTGGQLNGMWTLVGDRPGGGFVDGISELISPWGYVFDSKTSKQMLKSGMIGSFRGLAEAGDLQGGGGGVVNPTPNPIVYGTGTIKPPKKDKKDSGSTISTGDALGSVSSALDSAALATQIMSVQVRQQIQAAIIASQQKMSDQFSELISVMTGDNPRAVGEQVYYAVSRGTS